MADEIKKLNEGIADFNFDELTVEELEKRLELAIGALPPGGPLSCIDIFTCHSAFGCQAPGSFNCTNF